MMQEFPSVRFFLFFFYALFSVPMQVTEILPVTHDQYCSRRKFCFPLSFITNDPVVSGFVEQFSSCHDSTCNFLVE